MILGLLLAAQVPLMVLLERETVVYAPDGERITLPAGSHFEACSQNNSVLSYDLAGFLVTVANPCPEKPLFEDGFEAVPKLPYG